MDKANSNSHQSQNSQQDFTQALKENLKSKPLEAEAPFGNGLQIQILNQDEDLNFDVALKILKQTNSLPQSALNKQDPRDIRLVGKFAQAKEIQTSVKKPYQIQDSCIQSESRSAEDEQISNIEAFADQAIKSKMISNGLNSKFRPSSTTEFNCQSHFQTKQDDDLTSQNQSNNDSNQSSLNEYSSHHRKIQFIERLIQEIRETIDQGQIPAEARKNCENQNQSNFEDRKMMILLSKQQKLHKLSQADSLNGYIQTLKLDEEDSIERIQRKVKIVEQILSKLLEFGVHSSLFFPDVQDCNRIVKDDDLQSKIEKILLVENQRESLICSETEESNLKVLLCGTSLENFNENQGALNNNANQANPSLIQQAYTQEDITPRVLNPRRDQIVNLNHADFMNEHQKSLNQSIDISKEIIEIIYSKNQAQKEKSKLEFSLLGGSSFENSREAIQDADISTYSQEQRAMQVQLNDRGRDENRQRFLSGDEDLHQKLNQNTQQSVERQEESLTNSLLQSQRELDRRQDLLSFDSSQDHRKKMLLSDYQKLHTKIYDSKDELTSQDIKQGQNDSYIDQIHRQRTSNVRITEEGISNERGSESIQIYRRTRYDRIQGKQKIDELSSTKYVSPNSQSVINECSQSQSILRNLLNPIQESSGLKQQHCPLSNKINPLILSPNSENRHFVSMDNRLSYQGPLNLGSTATTAINKMENQFELKSNYNSFSINPLCTKIHNANSASSTPYRVVQSYKLNQLPKATHDIFNSNHFTQSIQSMTKSKTLKQFKIQLIQCDLTESQHHQKSSERKRRVHTKDYELAQILTSTKKNTALAKKEKNCTKSTSKISKDKNYLKGLKQKYLGQQSQSSSNQGRLSKEVLSLDRALNQSLVLNSDKKALREPKIKQKRTQKRDTRGSSIGPGINQSRVSSVNESTLIQKNEKIDTKINPDPSHEKEEFIPIQVAELGRKSLTKQGSMANSQSQLLDSKQIHQAQLLFYQNMKRISNFHQFANKSSLLCNNQAQVSRNSHKPQHLSLNSQSSRSNFINTQSKMQGNLATGAMVKRVNQNIQASGRESVSVAFGKTYSEFKPYENTHNMSKHPERNSIKSKYLNSHIPQTKNQKSKPSHSNLCEQTCITYENLKMSSVPQVKSSTKRPKKGNSSRAGKSIANEEGLLTKFSVNLTQINKNVNDFIPGQAKENKENQDINGAANHQAKKKRVEFSPESSNVISVLQSPEVVKSNARHSKLNSENVLSDMDQNAAEFSKDYSNPTPIMTKDKSFNRLVINDIIKDLKLTNANSRQPLSPLMEENTLALGMLSSHSQSVKDYMSKIEIRIESPQINLDQHYADKVHQANILVPELNLANQQHHHQNQSTHFETNLELEFDSQKLNNQDGLFSGQASDRQLLSNLKSSSHRHSSFSEQLLSEKTKGKCDQTLIQVNRFKGGASSNQDEEEDGTVQSQQDRSGSRIVLRSSKIFERRNHIAEKPSISESQGHSKIESKAELIQRQQQDKGDFWNEKSMHKLLVQVAEMKSCNQELFQQFCMKVDELKFKTYKQGQVATQMSTVKNLREL